MDLRPLRKVPIGMTGCLHDDGNEVNDSTSIIVYIYIYIYAVSSAELSVFTQWLSKAVQLGGMH